MALSVLVLQSCILLAGKTGWYANESCNERGVKEAKLKAPLFSPLLFLSFFFFPLIFLFILSALYQSAGGC